MKTLRKKLVSGSERGPPLAAHVQSLGDPGGDAPAMPAHLQAAHEAEGEEEWEDEQQNY